jgi:hypothetical protein
MTIAQWNYGMQKYQSCPNDAVGNEYGISVKFRIYKNGILVNTYGYVSSAIAGKIGTINGSGSCFTNYHINYLPNLESYFTSAVITDSYLIKVDILNDQF